MEIEILSSESDDEDKDDKDPTWNTSDDDDQSLAERLKRVRQSPRAPAAAAPSLVPSPPSTSSSSSSSFSSPTPETPTKTVTVTEPSAEAGLRSELAETRQQLLTLQQHYGHPGGRDRGVMNSAYPYSMLAHGGSGGGSPLMAGLGGSPQPLLQWPSPVQQQQQQSLQHPQAAVQMAWINAMMLSSPFAFTQPR